MARRLARNGGVGSVTAFRVDAVQHAAILRSEAQQTLRFASGGTEALLHPAAASDIVTMFKSPYHVPIAAMNQALRKIARMLSPDGHTYFSEPLFVGEFNELVGIFRDEQGFPRAGLCSDREGG